jgi:hypothetical protein
LKRAPGKTISAGHKPETENCGSERITAAVFCLHRMRRIRPSGPCHGPVFSPRRGPLFCGNGLQQEIGLLHRNRARRKKRMVY